MTTSPPKKPGRKPPRVAAPAKSRRTASGASKKRATPVRGAPRQRDARAPADGDARGDRAGAVDEIHERIHVAIQEHRLHPGTRLVEERLADVFGVGRARVREVLARLAHEQVVDLIPQRGAYVARPTIEQAMHVFEARRVIEPAVLRRLVEHLTPDRVERLRQHQVLEQEARRREDTRAIVRLSGEFHVLLAELAGNGAMTRQMRELSTLTCLIIFLYDAPTATSCRADEHLAVIDAVARRDVERAQRLMLEHLEHIESSLRLEPAAEDVDLETIFGQ
ncbi:MAG: GntR family transcriptional regulator [Lautropia sp.]